MVVAASSLLTTITACSSGSAHPHASTSATPTATSSQASYARYPTASALLAECAVGRGMKNVLSSAEQYIKSHPGASHQFLQGAAIRLTKSNDAAFIDWTNYAPNFNIGGKSLFAAWPMATALQDRLPTAVCGPGASARKIYGQVYAGWPSMLKQDPWGT